MVDWDGSIYLDRDYDAWGESVGSGRIGTFRYRTGYEDVYTRLLSFGARWYDPGIGRWLSQDPIIVLMAATNADLMPYYDDLTNLYRYARNSPLSMWDPTGLFDIFVFGSASFGIGPGVRGEGEGVLLAGYDTDKGVWGGTIQALGVAVGGHDNYVAVLRGSERTTLAHAAQSIDLQAISIGVEVPLVAGSGVEVGHYSSTEESGVFIDVHGGALGALSIGFGFSTDEIVTSVSDFINTIVRGIEGINGIPH